MAQAAKIWTTLDILNWSADYLDKKGVEDARNVVEWLLCDVLVCSRMQLYLQFDRPLTEKELAAFRPMLQVCAAHKPLEQVLGTAEFYGLTLKVNDHVLIPRPETERLVETVIEESKPLLKNLRSPVREEPSPENEDEKPDEAEDSYRPEPEIDILDLGAGSGCIGIALAKYIPQARITFVEKSPEAVLILRENCRRHDLENRVRIVEADMLSWWTDKKYHIVVSNPPYVSQNEMPGLKKNVEFYEPAMALSDGGDGLSFYRFFAENLQDLLLPGGLAAFEYGGGHQSEALLSLFAAYSPLVIKDYQQDDRVLLLRSGDDHA